MRLTLGIGLSNRSGTSEAPAGPTISASGSIDVSTFKIGTTQTITAGTASASGGGTVSYEFRHLANGEVKATTAAYAHVAIDDTEAGVAQWRAVETGGTNPGETSWQTVASGTITRVAPANTVAPVVSGSTSLGDVLSVTQGTWTGDALSYSYQWQRNNVDISGETGTTYTIAQADDAAAIRCVVTASNSGGDVSANSNAVTVDDFAVPSITGVPTIGGTAEVGQTLTATAASVTGNPTPSRTWQWERSGAPISGATSSTYTLVAADDGDTITVVQAETNAIGSDNAESAATAIVTYTAPTSGGGLADQSFTEDTGAQTYATAGDFTGDNLTYSLTTSVSGVTINSGTGVVSFNTDTMAVQSGTSIVVQATNSGGSVTSGFSLAITAASSAVNPSVSSDSYTAPASGNAANFDVTGSYSGADTLDLYAVVGTSPITVSEAQLIAGSGGTNTIEFFNIQGFSFASGDFDITGLTSASESANQLRYVIVERNNGGTTGVLTASDTISGLDFTAPAFSSAEVGNVNASTLRATFNSALYKSTVAGDWALIGNTISAVSFTPGNNYIDFTLGTAATASDDYTGDLSYTGTSLTDVADNSLATFSGQDVTNNVSGGGNSISSITGSPRQTSSGGFTVYIFETPGAIAFDADANFTINYEFIGAGAQGGGADGSNGGGGGGGGRVKTGSFSAVSGQTYSGLVGSGGSTSGVDADGQNGGASGITSGTNFPGTADGGGGGGASGNAGLDGGHGGGAGGAGSSAGGATTDGGNAGGANTGVGEGAGGGGESGAGNPNAGNPSYEGGDGAAGVGTTVPGESGNVGNGGGGGGGPTGGDGPNGAGAGAAWNAGNGEDATGVGNGGGGAHGFPDRTGGAGSRGQVAVWFTP